MLEVVQCAIEGEPIEVFGARFVAAVIVDSGEPTGERAVGGETAEACLPEVRVRGDEPGEDPVAVSVAGGFPAASVMMVPSAATAR